MPIAPTGLTLTDLILSIRRDLFDTDPSQYRWSDDILKRQIDRAVEQYSRVAPRIIAGQIPTIPRSRLYKAPAGCWWIERVEYQLNRRPKSFRTFEERVSPAISPPASAPLITPSGPVGSSQSTYLWAVTFAVPGGETLISPTAGTALWNTQVALLSGVPTGQYGTVARTIYRGATPSTLGLAGSIPDNTSSTFTDVLAATGAAPPAKNGTGGISWFELNLDNAQLPSDAGDFLEVSAAYKHELDALGTTIPQRHMDCVVLGAEAYAFLAYLTTTNDNLDYVDGQFHDRVDDTKAPPAWRAQAEAAMQMFQARLAEIKNEVSYVATPMPAWGDKPVRWERL